MDIDILNEIQNVDLSKVETSAPLLATGNVFAQIVSIDFEKKETQNGGNVNPWAIIKYSLAQAWKTVPIDGAPSKEIQPGFPLTERIYLAPWVDPKTNEVKNFGIQRLALLRECVLGKATEGTRFDPNELVGQSITLKLKFDPQPKGKQGEVFAPRTEVDGYIRKAGTK